MYIIYQFFGSVQNYLKWLTSSASLIHFSLTDGKSIKTTSHLIHTHIIFSNYWPLIPPNIEKIIITKSQHCKPTSTSARVQREQ